MKTTCKTLARFLAVVLSVILLVTAAPTAVIAQEIAGQVQDKINELSGGEAKAGNVTYVSLPITIRDYAADGMLFEYNDRGEKGDVIVTESGTGISEKTYSFYAVNPSGWGDNAYKGIRVVTSGYSKWDGSSLYWHAIVCKSDSTVYEVLVDGESKGDSSSGAYKNAMNGAGSGAYALWVWSGDTANYNILRTITDSNKANYRITYNETAKTIKIVNYGGTNGVGHHGNNLGFTLLTTTGASHFHDMNETTNTTGTPSPGIAIPGTQLIQNGAYNLQTVPSPVTLMLNSGASQLMYGSYVRTDLVEGDLGEDGKPVYTENTVSYVANYLSKTLPEIWKNSDGTYNLWYVMGVKLFDNNNNYVGNTGTATKDLASVLRSVITEGMGTYAAAKAKNPTEAVACSTYFDAAYYLLHNVFSDSQGYGMSIPQYTTLNMVQKTDETGTYYVFNSGYDNTVYDTVSKVIYNSQTDTITQRAITRGNIMGESAFNPVADLGYGKSGDTYVKTYGVPDSYYNTVNYNFTLEGHAKFIYYEDDNLYFDFTGDDDVYLYINGKRVLDLGAAHGISRARINLNDVAEICGLSDGEAYTFDFFYMERHGTAANFCINTNIRIVDPDMLTVKEGYENGVSTGYNGYVSGLTPIEYRFSLQNNGQAPLTDLTFTDPTLGVTLNQSGITLNKETSLSDLSVNIYGADDTVLRRISAGTLDESTLLAVLAGGIGVGERIEIIGFKHTVTDAEWSAGGGKFENTVYTTATAVGDNDSTKTLNGIATWVVQKQTYEFENLHLYEWGGHGVSMTRDELLAQIVAKNIPGFSATAATIELCSPSGSTTSSNINPNAIMQADSSITYTGDEAGVDSYYYLVTQGSFKAVIRVDVFSYDAMDDLYVLDYGLPADLNAGEYGYTKNDTLYLDSNPYGTEVIGVTVKTESDYFEYRGNLSLWYVMREFLCKAESITLTFEIREKGDNGALTKFNGVCVTETVTVAPASVMYYEDNFPTITYIYEGANNWEHVTYGDVLANAVQDIDPNANYGSDPGYTIDPEEGEASCGSLHVLNVQNTSKVMEFTFVGTGFELISRTTQGDYSVLNVTVQTPGSDGNFQTVKSFPVITECKGGDLYQVPVISVTELPYAEYHVIIEAAGSTETTNRMMYVDGLRIFNPLPQNEAEMYYRADEADAVVIEVKKLLRQGTSLFGNTNGFAEVNTFIEDIENSGFTLVQTDSLEKYLTFGPNNEVYFDPSAGGSVVVFYLQAIESVPEKNRTVQIGAHRKTTVEGENGFVTLMYASNPEELKNLTNTLSITSGTEQYYTCQVTPFTGNAYILTIGVPDCGSENLSEVLALTSIKLSGYRIVSFGGVVE